MDFKVEILKHPTDDDWMWCKTCTLNTVGKTSAKLPTAEWKHKILEAGHSPIRELWFGIKMQIPYYVSVHFVRHHIGVNHYVQTQRNDRQGNYDRTKATQDTMVSHVMSINAQELIFMSHKRLCSQASAETRAVMKEICKQVEELFPEFIGLLVPECVYRGYTCTEFYPCGLAEKLKAKNEKEIKEKGNRQE